ncbi:hypothetical protein EHO61_13400 [Leptospira fluminis]|uniref:Calcineurin-like phosphoesterase domain-containing protein n=1 Tax=Leptospira fluminis TaxID=2484979 RepID=A0A4R9GMC9_9LEPT|nr:metallophosphoesterase [Leptospira fluminis]TGK17388.1 hypothetical protein EHO61_13400 [Leptospira fluminis]
MKHLSLAIIGDIHGFWTSVDTEYFSKSEYDAVLFTGDLGTYSTESTFRVAQEISKIRKPCYLVPGNHDTTSLFQLLAEILHLPSFLTWPSLPWHLRRYSRFRKELGNIRICEYSLHREIAGLAILGARPLSMGFRMNFLPFLRKKFSVSSVADSVRRLDSLGKEAAEAGTDVLVLAHNGPAGLGSRASDIWGCDFRKEEGDFGDADLATFLENAVSCRRAPNVVIAGHMHHHTKRSVLFRIWKVRKSGILFINAARVPRIFRDAEGVSWHHHVRLTRKDGVWDAEAVYLRKGVEEVFPLPKLLEREKTSVQEGD